MGFQLPVKNVPALNGIHAGQSAPLIWQTFDSSGNPVTNLTLCSNTDGTGCTAPWVVVQTVAITCPGGALNTATDLTNADSGKSVLQNFGNGTYQFNLQTKRGSKGCFTPVLTITGFASYGVANFMFN